MIKFLRTSCIMLLCFAAAAFFIELVSSTAFHTNFFNTALQKTWYDKIILQNRWIASFRLSNKEIKMLKYPVTSNYNLTVLYNEPAVKLNALYSKEFYVGSHIFLVQNPEDAAFYKNRLKHQDPTYYTSTDQFVAGLKENLKGRKLIVTFGGSTTAWAFNWPFYLSQHLEKNYPGQFLVMNAGEPGQISWEHGFIIKSILAPFFKEEGIKPSLYLFMDGTNDTLLGTYWHLAFKIAEKLNMCTTHKKDYLDPAQIYFPMYKQAEQTAGTRVVKEMDSIIFRAMPYTSLILWRTLPAITPPSKPAEATQIADTAKDCNNDMMHTFNSIFINTHTDEIKAISSKNTKYNGATVNLAAQDSDAVLEFFNKGINFTLEASGDVPFYYFLQPEATESFYSLIPARTESPPKHAKLWNPSVDYCLKTWGISGLITDVFFNVDQQYQRNVALFNEFNQRYPNQFFSIADVFKSITDIKKDPYSPDAIHYTFKGSELIGDKIFSLLEAQNAFAKG